MIVGGRNTVGFAQTICFRGVPTHLRSDNGPGSIACQLHQWINHLGVRTLFIEPGSPWENGYIESFDGRMRNELLNGEVFFTRDEAKTLIARWRERSTITSDRIVPRGIFPLFNSQSLLQVCHNNWNILLG
jgi:hypothetical protein